MRGEPLTAFLICDLGGMVRGRLMASADVPDRLATGIGWVPADYSITPCGPLADPNPYGPLGDLRLIPDRATHVRVEFGEDVSPLELFLCDAVGTDGTPWDGCPRRFLADALAALEREAGLRLRAAFEHEFQFIDDTPPPVAFSLVMHRRVEPFGEMVVDAMRQAHLEPECFLPEYGEHQFEVTCAPADGMVAADRSIITKELVREVARLLDRPVTFTPLRREDKVGNGAHIHFSFADLDGRPATYDESAPGRLSRVAGQFAAGVLRHAPALTALVTPNPTSFLRLAPHRWSVGAACLGERNRETLLRISPVIEMSRDPAATHNLELRAVDATACPYLALGGIVHAGLEGVRAGLDCPPILDRDPAALTAEELAAYDTVALPGSLAEALDCLDADEIAKNWFAPLLYETYVGVKREELKLADGLDNNEMCRRYESIY